MASIYPWYAKATDQEIDAHHNPVMIRGYLGEHVSPDGHQYRLVKHDGRTVSAHYTGKSGQARPTTAGYLTWFGGKASDEDRTIKGRIYKVHVSERHRRQGLASAMLDFARAQAPEDDIEHSQALTPDGAAWAEKKAGLSGSLPEGLQMEHTPGGAERYPNGKLGGWSDHRIDATIPHPGYPGGEHRLSIGSIYLDAQPDWQHEYFGGQPGGYTGPRRVSAVSVDSRYQRRGVAAALWEHAKALGLNPQHDDDGIQFPDGKAWAEKTASGEDHDVYWHITDKPHFKPDPNYSPDNNTTMGGSYSKGLFLAKDPNHWGTAYGYQRPYMAEVHVPKHVDTGSDGYGGERFVKGEDLHHVKVHRVIPADEYIRETYHSPGRIEEFHGVGHDGRAIERGSWGQKNFADKIGPGYRYSGPDVRDMSPEQHRQHYERWRDYAAAGGIEGYPFGHNEFDDEKMTLRSDEASPHDIDDEGQFIMRDRQGRETGRKWAAMDVTGFFKNAWDSDFDDDFDEEPERESTCRLCGNLQREDGSHPYNGVGPNDSCPNGRKEPDWVEEGQHDPSRYCDADCQNNHLEDISRGISTHHVFSPGEREEGEQRPGVSTTEHTRSPFSPGPFRQPSQYEVRDPSHEMRCHYCRKHLIDLKSLSRRTTMDVTAFFKHAHDSGDGETIYHCLFCGFGQVIARSDRTIECEFCHTCFTVQVQPQYSAFPQTVNGVPVDVPGMPGQVGQDPADPAMGGDPAAAGAPPGAPGGDVPPGQEDAADADSPFPPSDDDGDSDGKKKDDDDDDDKGNPFTSSLVADGQALDRAAYRRRLALVHSDDRAQTLAAMRAGRVR